MRILNKILTAFFVTVAFSGACLAHSPKIFAHRGGRADFPENTLYAFKHSVDAGVDGIELDVQLTRDEKVVVYHPHDLAANTNGQGAVLDHTYEELRKLDAAFKFDPSKDESFPQRSHSHSIPLLDDILKVFPSTSIVIDFKSLPVEPLVDATIAVVNKHSAWNRIVFYSTEAAHLIYLASKAPQAKMFEHRHITRERLLNLRNNGRCCCALSARYIGFELDREMVVEEVFALGTDSNRVKFKLWDSKAMACARKKSAKNPHVFLFGINDVPAYAEARKLEAYAVFTDNPLALLKSLARDIQ
jgi:glycerophosphoryl diester phosphodiesterase